MRLQHHHHLVDHPVHQDLLQDLQKFLHLHQGQRLHQGQLMERHLDQYLHLMHYRPLRRQHQFLAL